MNTGFIAMLLFLWCFCSHAQAEEWAVYEGHAIKKNGTGGRLNFSDTNAHDLAEFVDLCKKACENGDGNGQNGNCGAFVLNFTDAEKTLPDYCVFKLQGAEPYEKEAKDTYVLVDSEVMGNTPP